MCSHKFVRLHLVGTLRDEFLELTRDHERIGFFECSSVEMERQRQFLLEILRGNYASDALTYRGLQHPALLRSRLHTYFFVQMFHDAFGISLLMHEAVVLIHRVAETLHIA